MLQSIRKYIHRLWSQSKIIRYLNASIGRHVQAHVLWLGWAGLALAFVALSLTVLPHVVNLAPEAAMVRTQLAQKFTASVQLNDSIELRLWPRPSLRLTNMRLTHKPSKSTAQAGVVDIQLALWPLLKGKFTVAGLRLHDAQIVLVSATKGDWVSLLTHTPSYDFTIINAQLRLRDALPTPLTLQNVQAQLDCGNGQCHMRLEGRHKKWPLRARAHLGAITGPASNRIRRVQFHLVERHSDMQMRFGGQLLLDPETNTPPELNGEFTVEGHSAANVFLHPLGLEIADGPVPPQLSGIVRAGTRWASFDNFVLQASAGRAFIAMHLNHADATMRHRINMRVRIEQLHLDHLLAHQQFHLAQPDDFLSQLLVSATQEIQVYTQLSIDNFILGGERLALTLTAQKNANGLVIPDMVFTLPQGGRVQVQGHMRQGHPHPEFVGVASVRSHQAHDVMVWAVGLLGPDAKNWVGQRATQLRQVYGQAALRLNTQGLWLTQLDIALNEMRHQGDWQTLWGEEGYQSRLRLTSDYMALDDFGVSLPRPAQWRPQEEASQILQDIADFLGFALGPRHVFDLQLTSSEVWLDSQRGNDMQLVLRTQADMLELVRMSVKGWYGLTLNLTGWLTPSRARVPHTVEGWLAMQFESEQAGLLLPWLAEQPSFDWQKIPALSQPLTGSFYWLFPPLDTTTVASLSGQGRLANSEFTFDMTGRSAQLLPFGSRAQLFIQVSGPQGDWRSDIADTDAQRPMRFDLRMVMDNQQSAHSDMQLHLPDLHLDFSGHLRPLMRPVQIHGLLRVRSEPVPQFVATHLSGLLHFTETQSLDAQLQLSGSAKRLAFTRLDMRLGRTQFMGDGVVNLAQTPPYVTAYVRAPHLDLSLRPAAQLAPLNWSYFSRFNASVDGRLDDVQWGQMRFRNLRTDVRLHDSVLQILAREFYGFGGRLRVQLQLEGGSLLPTMTLTGRVAQIALDQLLAHVVDQPMMQARADMDFAMKSHGQNWAAHARTLDGQGRIRVGRGQLERGDLARLVEQFNGLQSLHEITPLLRATLSGGATLFQPFEAGYDWKDGQLYVHAPALRLRDYQTSKAVGQGNLHLHYSTRHKQLVGELGVQLASNPKQALPPMVLKITGALPTPSWQWETKALESALRERILRNNALGGLGLPPALP